jgi:hypothetical protein
MYFAAVALLTFLLPVASIYAAVALLPNAPPLIVLVGQWFVFWAGGIRLVLAGLRQFFQPSFTSKEIFGLTGDDALPFVRELGIANFATGVVGAASLVVPSFVLPIAISAGIFYSIAGFRHLTDRDRTRKQNIAMVSDLFVFAVLAVYVGYAVIGIA